MQLACNILIIHDIVEIPPSIIARAWARDVELRGEGQIEEQCLHIVSAQYVRQYIGIYRAFHVCKIGLIRNTNDNECHVCACVCLYAFSSLKTLVIFQGNQKWELVFTLRNSAVGSLNRRATRVRAIVYRTSWVERLG